MEEQKLAWPQTCGPWTSFSSCSKTPGQLAGCQGSQKLEGPLIFILDKAALTNERVFCFASAWNYPTCTAYLMQLKSSYWLIKWGPTNSQNIRAKQQSTKNIFHPGHLQGWIIAGTSAVDLSFALSQAGRANFWCLSFLVCKMDSLKSMFASTSQCVISLRLPLNARSPSFSRSFFPYGKTVD